MADSTLHTGIDRSPSPSFAGIAPIAILLLLFAMLPLLASVTGNPFLLKIGTRVIVFSLAAVALNIVLGFGGLVSLLHAGLFGIGGYAVGVLAFQAESNEPLFGFIPGSTELAIVLPVAICVSALAAAVMGMVSLRTGGAYFIMITLAFNQMLYYFFIALQKYGGEDGLQINGDVTLFGYQASARLPFFWGCLITLGIVLILLQRLVSSRFGVVLRASSQNRRRLAVLGIPPFRYQLAAFAISGAIAGLGGGLLAAGQQFISPSEMSWVRSGDLVVMCVLGGMSTVWGPMLGAAAFLILEIVLSGWTVYWQLGFGLIIIGIVVLLRGGLTELLRVVVAMVRRP